MKVTLDRNAIKVAYCAVEKLKTRRCLYCVRIGEGEIVASDGFILAIRPVPTDPPTGEAILINAADILGAQKAWKAKSLTIETVGERYARVTDETGKHSMDVELHQGKYPNYKELFSTTEEKVHIVLNKSCLVRLNKIIPKAMKIPLKIKIRGELDPIEFITDEIRLLVKPMCISWKD